MDNIKEELYMICKKIVKEKLTNVNKIIKSNQIALQTETKSSAGDKHETGRAMLQLEMEKVSQQFNSINKMQIILQKIPHVNNTQTISLGSVVHTSFQNYYLSISVGEVKVMGQNIYCISTLSPIGKELLGKQKGDTFKFNDRFIEILNTF
jgi:transcription elongation GreA/GreB family factor